MNLPTATTTKAGRVLPDIKVDADSRNIEELEVDPDPERFRPRKSAEQIEELAAKGFRFKDYDGMMPEMADRTLVIDDISQYETEKTDRNLQTSHLLRRNQGKIRHPEERHPDETASQLRFRRSIRRLQGGDQLLSGDRPHGEQPSVEHTSRLPGRKIPNLPPHTLRMRLNKGREETYATATYSKRNQRTKRPDDQPGQDLPADRGHVRRSGHSRLPAAQSRLAGLLRISPKRPYPPLQRTGHGRHQFLHRRVHPSSADRPTWCRR